MLYRIRHSFRQTKPRVDRYAHGGFCGLCIKTDNRLRISFITILFLQGKWNQNTATVLANSYWNALPN